MFDIYKFTGLSLFFLTHIQIISFSSFVYKLSFDGNTDYYSVWDFKKLLDNSDTSEYNTALNWYFTVLLFSIVFSSSATIATYARTGFCAIESKEDSYKSILFLLICNFACDLSAFLLYELDLKYAFENSEFFYRYIAYYFIIIGLLISTAAIGVFCFAGYLFRDNEGVILKVKHFLVPFLQSILGMLAIFVPWVYRADLKEYKTLINLFTDSVNKQKNWYITIISFVSFALFLNVSAVVYNTIKIPNMGKTKIHLVLTCFATLFYILSLIFILACSDAYDLAGHKYSIGFIILNIMIFIGLLDSANETRKLIRKTKKQVVVMYKQLRS